MRRISIIFLSLLVSITGLGVTPANAGALADGCYGVSANGTMQSVYELDGPGCEGAIAIDPSVVRIEYATYIYQGPNKITSISIPAETTFISYYPFNFNTGGLQEFIVHPDNPNFSSVDGVLYNKNQTTLISYPGGKVGTSFTVPPSVTKIDSFAFGGNYLETVIIGENVDVIGYSAFSITNFQYLQAIIVSPENQNYSSLNGVLFNKDFTTLIHYPKDKNNLSYTVPVTVTTIKSITYNQYLQSITLPNGLETIEQYALSYSALTSLHIPDSVTSYGPFPTFASGQLQFFSVGEGSNTLKAIDGVLYSKDGTVLIEYPGGKLQRVFTIPSGVTTLENQWLSGYIDLEKIRIPSSVTNIVGGLYLALEFLGDSNLASAPSIGPSQIFYCGAENSVISAAASRANISVQCVSEPDAPTIGTATALSPTRALISFTAPANNGGATIETYTAISTPSSLTGSVYQSGSGSITISGLLPSTAYTFTVTASNSAGTSLASSATVSITTPASTGDSAAQSAGQPTYYPFGPQLAVPSGEVLNGGWELCWSGPYNGFAKFSEIRSACTESYIMYTGWQGVSTSPETFPDRFNVLAAGPRSEVFRDTTNASEWTVNEANGSYWSFGDDREATFRNAVGFSDATEESGSPLIGSPCFDGEKSICWHSAPTLPINYGWNDADNPSPSVPTWVTTEPGLSPGWALNSIDFLGQAPDMGNGALYTRAIFQTKRISVSINNTGISAAAAALSAAAAAKREAEKREAEKRSARSEISSKFAKLEKVTLETFIMADIDGITAKNLEAVEKEILALPEKSRSDMTEILQIARKFEVVAYIASDSPNSIYPSRLVEIGLIPADSKFKSSITVALRNLPASERSTYAEIKVAIDKEIARIKAKKDRLASLISRVSARKAA